MKKKDAFRRKNDFGIAFVLILLFSSIILGYILFKKYLSSSLHMNKIFENTKLTATNISIEDCAKKTMDFYKDCREMKQVCDESVSKMIKVCLVNGDKSSECKNYGNEVFGYNFGFKECSPFLKNRDMKKACADTWQSIADFCKAVWKEKQDRKEPANRKLEN